MFRKRGMITEEIHRALAELEDDDIEGVSVAITPPIAITLKFLNNYYLMYLNLCYSKH